MVDNRLLAGMIPIFLMAQLDFFINLSLKIVFMEASSASKSGFRNTQGFDKDNKISFHDFQSEFVNDF